ncbi:RNA polymerase sigma factor RpoE [Aliikangiella coralliicola]|uniref:RNA polymerase sigma factor RpoE n=1 Tax=Aliikangiella coralliicola TaxID=2592383 RepID=A0A545U696_9GAMM|nr:RNA polymerase sigma factor RpoE [Aliikangiella coralliicola]TQV84992.1 RNA polymerase sigma factor RpoE [Aliikangiella coralliicola]
MSNTTDAELVERVQRGDKRAFDLLVSKYQNKIFVIIGRFINDHAEVHDVAQDTFIKAYRALPNFRGESQFYTWIYRIAINTAKNYLTARGRRPPASDIDSQEAENFGISASLKENASPERLLARDQLKKVIFDTIDDLPEDLKTAITLREMEGMSYEEIAESMNCPVGTVRSRIFRAREAIDEQIKPLMDSRD